MENAFVTNPAREGSAVLAISTTTRKILTNRAYRFILSLGVGAAIGASLLATFSTFSPSWLGSIVLSGMTYSGFAFILFGFFYKKNGVQNFTGDFLLGLGVGLIVVWFIGAGNGTITSIDLNY
jgi:hypothetical protein